MLSFLWMGCASVLSGSAQTIEINSNVPGVGVYDQGQYLGSTPLRIEIPRQAEKELSLEHKGYVNRIVTLKSKTNGNVWWNLPFTVLGLTGVSTDYGSGAIYEYSPHRYYIAMKTIKGSQETGADDFAFLNREGLDEEQARHQKGELSRTNAYLTRNSQLGRPLGIQHH